MTAFTVEFERGAQKSLKKMDPQQARIIMSWIKKNLSGRMIRVVMVKDSSRIARVNGGIASVIIV